MLSGNVEFFGKECKKNAAKQKHSQWRDGLLTQMSKDLKEKFPDMKGFSLRNIKYMSQWYLFWNEGDTIGQELVAQTEKSQQPVGQLVNAK